MDFNIERIDFKKDKLITIDSKFYVVENWPIVYVLDEDNRLEAYVGETTDTISRITNHINTPQKKHFQNAYLISSNKFNKSVTLDIEQNLINYIHGDGKYKLLNGNGGQQRHTYFQKENYWEQFKNIWNELRSLGIATRSLESIENSDLFKYSPYKTLSSDQTKNLMIIIDSLLSSDKKSILVEGGAGTGKSILAIFLFKLILSDNEDFNYKEFGEDDALFYQKVQALKKKYPNPKMGLVIAMSSFRETIQNVFRKISGLKAEMVIGPTKLATNEYDILIIDEAHRLRHRKNLVSYFSFDNTARALGLDPKKTNELEWTLMKSKKSIYFYDENQSIKPSDISPANFDFLRENGNTVNVKLFSQFRSKGGDSYIVFIDKLLNCKLNNETYKFSHKVFELKLFENFDEFVVNVKNKNSEIGLSRFVAGYGWEWISKNDLTKFDIVIDGIQFQWNHDSIDYITKDQNADQIGCIHTVQGYDLNYVGLIFGPEIYYDPEIKLIKINKRNYFDRNGRINIDTEEELHNYIINIYKTIMLRGILGCYIYVCDKNLRNYFREHIYLFNENKSPIIDTVETKQIKLNPFENSVPLYSLKVAAGDFFESYDLTSNENELIAINDNTRLSTDNFACKIIGNSMNNIIQDGKIALFKKTNDQGRSNNGKIVLVQLIDSNDDDSKSSYTIKEYFSEEPKIIDGVKSRKLILIPQSSDPSYKNIVFELSDDTDKKVHIIAEFVKVIG
jgi:DUF2075 family protein/DNA replication protein DnaC